MERIIVKKEHNQHKSVFKVFRLLLFYVNVTDPLIIQISFYLFVKRLLITNSVEKFQNLAEIVSQITNPPVNH